MSAASANESGSLLQVEIQLIKYDNAYVAFIDVLGFRELVQSPTTDKVSAYYSVIKESIADLTKLLEQFGTPHTQIMSDSIVFAVIPTSNSKEDKINSLRALCGSICYLQFYLSLQGIWVRGGLAYGGICFHENQFVVGPALVSAVELEKIAKYPRVVLQPMIAKDLQLTNNQLVRELQGPRENGKGTLSWVFDPETVSQEPLLTDLLFLNFSVFMTDEHKYAEESAQKVSNHLKAGLYGSAVHLEKYRWIQNYFRYAALKPSAQKYLSEL